MQQVESVWWEQLVDLSMPGKYWRKRLEKSCHVCSQKSKSRQIWTKKKNWIATWREFALLGSWDNIGECPAPPKAMHSPKTLTTPYPLKAVNVGETPGNPKAFNEELLSVTYIKRCVFVLIFFPTVTRMNWHANLIASYTEWLSKLLEEWFVGISSSSLSYHVKWFVNLSD